MLTHFLLLHVFQLCQFSHQVIVIFLLSVKFFLLCHTDTALHFKPYCVFMHCISVKELLVTYLADETSLLFARIVCRVWSRLGFQTICAIKHTTELTIRELRLLLATDPAPERVGIIVPLRKSFTQLEDGVIFIVPDVHFLSDLDVIDFLGYPLVLCLQLSPERI